MQESVKLFEFMSTSGYKTPEITCKSIHCITMRTIYLKTISLSEWYFEEMHSININHKSEQKKINKYIVHSKCNGIFIHCIRYKWIDIADNNKIYLNVTTHNSMSVCPDAMRLSMIMSFCPQTNPFLLNLTIWFL